MTIPKGYERFRMGGLATLYKGSERGPEDVFKNGWPVKTGDIDIGNHLLNKGKNSCWWSTSLDKYASTTFGRYIYVLVGLNNEAIVANEAYVIVKKKTIDQIPFAEQAEMSVYSTIPFDHVAGVFDNTTGYGYTPNVAAKIPQNFFSWLT